MTILDKSIDGALNHQPLGSRAKVGLVSIVRAFVRLRRNRREIAQLADLDDSQLADIGLTRAVVDRARYVGRFVDPSGHLIAQANIRRSGIRRDHR